jgi:two-component system, OmpR family, sensor histidine kinase KdpD
MTGTGIFRTPKERPARVDTVTTLEPVPAKGSARGRPLGLLVTTLLIGVALAAALLIENLVKLPNILLIFLPVVLFSAVRFGLLAASWASILAIMATSFFLAEPTMSFAVSEPSNVWALLIFLAVAAVTSSLAAQVRQRAAAADRHSRTVEALYEFSSKLGAVSSAEELIQEAARQIEAMLGVAAVLLVPRDGSLRAFAPDARNAELSPAEWQAAEWCWQHGQPTGRNTGTFHGVARLFLPLDAGRGAGGALGLFREGPGPLLGADELRLLDNLVRQVAINLERGRLAEEMHRSEMLAATEKLRTALLTSISHDLKTPLASILGNVTSLRQYGHLYDEQTRLDTLAATAEEAIRLSRFVDNLLHMTRIDAGALRPTLEPVELADLVGSALKRLEKRLAGHHIETVLAEDLPMIPLDFVLAEHTLVNVLENAAKYSPAGTAITVAAQERERAVVVTVADEGPGIPAADLQRVFERFFRGPAADHRPVGVGLGLAVCKGFVEAMGGRISAENRSEGAGVMITIEFRKGDVQENAA